MGCVVEEEIVVFILFNGVTVITGEPASMQVCLHIMYNVCTVHVVTLIEASQQYSAC